MCLVITNTPSCHYKAPCHHQCASSLILRVLTCALSSPIYALSSLIPRPDLRSTAARCGALSSARIAASLYGDADFFQHRLPPPPPPPPRQRGTRAPLTRRAASVDPAGGPFKGALHQRSARPAARRYKTAVEPLARRPATAHRPPCLEWRGGGLVLTSVGISARHWRWVGISARRL